MVIEIGKTGKKAKCQICEKTIKENEIKLRFVISNHSESVHIGCCKAIY